MDIGSSTRLNDAPVNNRITIGAPGGQVRQKTCEIINIKHASRDNLMENFVCESLPLRTQSSVSLPQRAREFLELYTLGDKDDTCCFLGSAFQPSQPYFLN